MLIYFRRIKMSNTIMTICLIIDVTRLCKECLTDKDIELKQSIT